MTLVRFWISKAIAFLDERQRRREMTRLDALREVCR